MAQTTLPKDELAAGNETRAVYAAALRLKAAPSDAQRHLDLLAAVSSLNPDRIPAPHGEKLFTYFTSTANFPGSFATLVYLSRREQLPDTRLLERFLTTFGPSGTKGPSITPPQRTEAEVPVEIPEALNVEETLDMALEIWDTASASLFLPPPAQGRSVALFQAMGQDSLGLLLRDGVLRFIPAQEQIITQGEVDSSFYILVSGVLEVYRQGETGKTRLGHLRSGTFFGEMSLVTSGPRNATIVASESSIIVEIPWGLLSAMLEHDPALADELARYTRFRLLKNLMATSPLFKTLSTEAKADLISAFEPVVPEGGASIIREGDSSSGLYLVASGEVRVIAGKGGDKTLLGVLGPGSVFGEISLIRDTPATASIRVEEEGVVLLQLTKARFDQLAVLYPDLLSHIYQVALDRSETTKKVKADVAIPAEDLVF